MEEVRKAYLTPESPEQERHFQISPGLLHCTGASRAAKNETGLVQASFGPCWAALLSSPGCLHLLWLLSRPLHQHPSNSPVTGSDSSPLAWKTPVGRSMDLLFLMAMRLNQISLAPLWNFRQPPPQTLARL
ncbi:uncharacterized protein LOC104669883 isoform X2 [Rhinopithecus roxellana]|uniref:uncharacterized protein LOC104669883 isoform X2 n=1 Tax=Rhinopithecus roxellana TaxID=61622 RepID=UPI00053354EE|nr:uncharacterized protein LOC104669883 isoform X2 [Rhinopithecus roxellana]